MTTLLRLACFAGLLAGTPAAHADDVRTMPVRFAPGATAATLRGTITGRGSISYTLGAEAGQTLKVMLKAGASTSFNLYAPGRGPGDEALAIGEMLPELNLFEGKLPASGVYTINVFLNRAAGRRNARSSFTLTVSIPAGAAATDPAKGGTTDLAAACRRLSAVDFATRPSRIRTAGTRPGPEGPMVDATADLGTQGLKPFACRFDTTGRYLGILSKVNEGSL